MSHPESENTDTGDITSIPPCHQTGPHLSCSQASLQDHVPATILALDIWEDTKPADDCRNGLLAKTELGCSGECAKL